MISALKGRLPEERHAFLLSSAAICELLHSSSK